MAGRRETYNFSHRKRGTAYIINNVDFKQGGAQKRWGSDKDMAVLAKTFQTLGFHGEDIMRYRNVTVEKMKKCLRDSVEFDDHADSDMFMCAILTHGGQGMDSNAAPSDIVCGTDAVISVRELMKIMEDCPDLAGKPKIFLVQACRGTKLSAPAPTSSDAAEIKEDIIEALAVPFVQLNLTAGEQGEMKNMPAQTLPSEIPISRDFLLAYTTQPGFFSFRHTTLGSPFVNHLCRQVHTPEAKHMDFQRLLTRVNHDVAHSFTACSTTEPWLSGKKLMPWVASRLTKDVVFSEKVTEQATERPPIPVQESTPMEH